jgi:hypothetical protein
LQKTPKQVCNPDQTQTPKYNEQHSSLVVVVYRGFSATINYRNKGVAQNMLKRAEKKLIPAPIEPKPTIQRLLEQSS